MLNFYRKYPINSFAAPTRRRTVNDDVHQRSRLFSQERRHRTPGETNPMRAPPCDGHARRFRYLRFGASELAGAGHSAGSTRNWSEGGLAHRLADDDDGTRAPVTRRRISTPEIRLRRRHRGGPKGKFPRCQRDTCCIWSYPWCHRVSLTVALRGLEDRVRIVKMTDDAERASRGGWVFESDRPDPVFRARDLREVYDRRAASPTRTRVAAQPR